MTGPVSSTKNNKVSFIKIYYRMQKKQKNLFISEFVYTFCRITLCKNKTKLKITVEFQVHEKVNYQSFLQLGQFLSSMYGISVSSTPNI